LGVRGHSGPSTRSRPFCDNLRECGRRSISVGATDSSAKLSKALRHCVPLHAARLASPNHR
jgi:hypothetical protein